ncbi:MAG: uracil-DNA glycosylase [Anaerolineaceae bacterium]|nr:uracil-DNA glycosylase [Anaerolineaceae bacterium]
MTDPTGEFLEALRHKLESLRLAGLRRIPRILSALETAAATPQATGPQMPEGGFSSVADFARHVRQQLNSETGRRQMAATQAPGPPAGKAGSAAARAATQSPPSAEFDETLRPSRPVDPEIEKQLAALAEEVGRCTRCRELAAARTQTVFKDGPPNADLMFVGEAPGQDEDAQGVPFVGRAGQLLTKIVSGGLKMRRRDVYVCNILKCRPPGNRNPRPDEAANCREYLDAQIDLVRPKVICCLGGIATRFLLDDPTPVGRMRGRWYSYRGVAVRVTYHPAYLLRNYTKDARTKVWDDVKQVAAKLRELRDAPGGPVETEDGLF